MDCRKQRNPPLVVCFGEMLIDPGAPFVTLRSDGEREFMFYRNPSADMLLQES